MPLRLLHLACLAPVMLPGFIAWRQPPAASGWSPSGIMTLLRFRPLRSPSRRTDRAVRAVEVLERIGTAAARILLADWARGTRTARLTREARLSLERLERRSVSVR